MKTGLTPEGLVTPEMIPKLVESTVSLTWGSTGRTLRG